jgi:hypothetical protein
MVRASLLLQNFERVLEVRGCISRKAVLLFASELLFNEQAPVYVLRGPKTEGKSGQLVSCLGSCTLHFQLPHILNDRRCGLLGLTRPIP